MRTVVIIGKAENAAKAPAAGVELWGCNESFMAMPGGSRFDRWDRWFDVHTRAHIVKHRPRAWRWYRRQSRRRPIYLHKPYVAVPGSRAFPIAKLQQAFGWGGHPEEFFTSSVDFMLALAIHEGVDRIELYGVDMYEAPHERGEQRNGAHYWIGIARGRGIDVHIPDDSSLCKTDRLYGYFRPTSARNYKSMSCTRFIRQIRLARSREAADYVEPGLDTKRPMVVNG